MWGHYLKPTQNQLLQAESSMRVDAATFPANTTFYWDIVPDPGYGGINGYLAVTFGTGGSAGTFTPRQVNAITALSIDIGWAVSGNSVAGLLSELWLDNISATAGTPTHTHEIGFLIRTPAGGVSWFAGLPLVGTFTDSAGLTWTVRQATDATGTVPYFPAMLPGNPDFQGVLPFREYLTFLKTQGKITGTEWMNAVMFGIEPQSGIGSLTINKMPVTYTGT